MRVFALAALLTAACSGPIPVYLTSSEVAGVIVEPSQEARDVLDEGFGTWGLEYELIHPDFWGSYGALSIALIDAEGDVKVAGETRKIAPCRPETWSDFDGQYLAHEIGHAFGLEHVDDPANLMHVNAGVPGWRGEAEITDEQFDTVYTHVGRFLACADDA